MWAGGIDCPAYDCRAYKRIIIITITINGTSAKTVAEGIIIIIISTENKIIVQASHDTGACYGVAKCAEIAFEHGKMVRGEGLKVLEERMKTIDPNENEIYKFLGQEQADGIKAEAVFERIKGEISKRVKLLTKTELNDANLIQAINKKVMPVAAYAMNVCKCRTGELNELDR